MINSMMVLALPAAICTAGAPSGPAIHGADGPSTTTVALAPAADSLAAVYAQGRDWSEFYGGVDRRQDLWIENWTRAEVPVDLATRARNVGGPWRILVITEPGCSDSANSVPYIAKLVETTPGLEMRLVNSTVGRPWMEAYRTKDGRAATPTVLILDENFEIRGTWIEQPVELQEFWLPVVARGTMAQEVGAKMQWYADDEGRETLREIVEVLEAAHRGDQALRGRQLIDLGRRLAETHTQYGR